MKLDLILCILNLPNGSDRGELVCELSRTKLMLVSDTNSAMPCCSNDRNGALVRLVL